MSLFALRERRTFVLGVESGRTQKPETRRGRMQGRAAPAPPERGRRSTAFHSTGAWEDLYIVFYSGFLLIESVMVIFFIAFLFTFLAIWKECFFIAFFYPVA